MIRRLIYAAATIATSALTEARWRTRAIVAESKLAQAECQALRLRADLAATAAMAERAVSLADGRLAAFEVRLGDVVPRPASPQPVTADDSAVVRSLVTDAVRETQGWDVDDLRDVELEDDAIRVRVPCVEVDLERRRLARVEKARSAL
jgi:hypothetical protein